MKERFIRKQSALLIFYDICIEIFTCFIILYVYWYYFGRLIEFEEVLLHSFVFILLQTGCRLIGKIYNQIWRYGGVQCYLKLIYTDLISLFFYCLLERIWLLDKITVANSISLFSISCLGSLTIRLVYRYYYKFSNSYSRNGKLMGKLLRTFSAGRVKPAEGSNIIKIPVAILGAGRIGASLAEELSNNIESIYMPVMFLETKKDKIGGVINNLPVYSDDVEAKVFSDLNVQEIIFTVPDMSFEKRQKLYQKYTDLGLKIKAYDYPQIQTADEKRTLREFDVEELLFRKPVYVVDDNTKKYFKNKVVLITGGGGSIGSEMARQVAKMEPKQIILLDMYENGVYDNKTDLKFAYGDKLDLAIEICSVCNKQALNKVFTKYKPNIVIHAAAHKHVPLMEYNCVESIENNIFGTLNTVEMSEKHGVQRFIMVSTDKAVNPVNVMGATKRMCEMIVNAHSHSGKTKTTFSTTRFGNVLNSAGSVIPIFKRELAKGGPLTVTDFRIIRYFMTIPEASQLVLKSSAMAKNGELFVLDMGKPVKILDLAKSIIRLSGLEPNKDIDIVEIGLRPGEKLYEELLIDTNKLNKTEDKLIFVENDEKISMSDLNKKLKLLAKAVEENDDAKAKEVLKKVVPTYKDPEEVNNVCFEAE